MDYGINGRRTSAWWDGLIEFRHSVLSMYMRVYVGMPGSDDLMVSILLSCSYLNHELIMSVLTSF